MPRADLPLCPRCGAWCSDCGHAPEPRLTWIAEPLRHRVLAVVGMAVFTVLFAAVLMGIGPLIWWLTYGWPPQTWIELLGVIAVALISLPGWVVGIGLVLSIPEHDPGRLWNLRDAAPRDQDTWFGAAVVRRALLRASATRVARLALPRPPCPELTSETAAPRLTTVLQDMSQGPAAAPHPAAPPDPAALADELTRLLTAALAGLVARGRVVVYAARSHGWSRAAPDAAPATLDHLHHTLAVQSPDPTGAPWLEAILLRELAHGREVSLHVAAQFLLDAVAPELGFVYEHDVDHTARWRPPDVAARLLVDTAAVDAALVAWRALDPALVGPALDTWTDALRARFAPAHGDDDDTAD